MNEKDFLDCCQIITALSALKGIKKEADEIAYISKFLLKELKISDIQKASHYLSRRKIGFPDVSDFYNLIVPLKTIEETAEEEIGSLLEMVKNGTFSKDEIGVIKRDLLNKWSWAELSNMNSKELLTTRQQMSFYLKAKLQNDGFTKIENNFKSIEVYKGANNEKDQIEQTGTLGNMPSLLNQ